MINILSDPIVSSGDSMFESVPDAVLVVDPHGSIVSANRHAERLFGYETGGLVGLAVETRIPEFSQRRAKRFAAPAACPFGCRQETRGLRRDGRELPVEVLTDATDAGASVVAIVRDLGGELATRAQLRQSEQRSRSILDALDSHLAVLSRDGEILAVNRAWRDFARENCSGSDASIDVGVNYLEACQLAADDDPDARKALAGIRSVLQGSRQLFTLEYPCHSPWQERWFSMRVTPTRTKEGGAVIVHTDVSERVLARLELERSLAEVDALRRPLEAETACLRKGIDSEHVFAEVIGQSQVMKAVFHQLDQAAKTDATVLLIGETGTGKELLARAIHARSHRAGRSLVKVDCTTLPSSLIESELFGHEKGAFTGADAAKMGRFEWATGGTIFLDEIGELSIELQAKLLRVLQDREIQPLGSNVLKKVDVRVIAATNRDLRDEVREGRFRPDLYYRLGVFPVECPPLRDRRDDIPLLVSAFLSKYCATLGKKIDSIATATMDALIAYDWPGNVRELQNVVERAVILCSGHTLIVEPAVGDCGTRRATEDLSLKCDLESIERAKILRVLEESDWKVKGEGNAASRLGLKPSTLRSRMKKLGITKPSAAASDLSRSRCSR